MLLTDRCLYAFIVNRHHIAKSNFTYNKRMYLNSNFLSSSYSQSLLIKSLLVQNWLFVFPGQHQREVFLFNDILVITKIHSRRKNSVTYTFRGSHPLAGMMVNLFENSYYSYGITLSQRWDRKVVITLNARNDHDR